MTSKDKAIYIDELLKKTYSDTVDYLVISSNIEDIIEDLDRLEKLEKVIDFFKNHFQFKVQKATFKDKSIHYYLRYRQGFDTYLIILTEELYDLLKEVLSD